MGLGFESLFSSSLANTFGAWPLYLGLSLFFSALCTPFLIKIASKKGWLDRPGFRKVHTAPVPRLGGVAIYLAIWLSWLLFSTLNPDVIPYESSLQMRGLFIASTMVWILGIYDDLVGANAIQKIIVQLLASLVVVKSGIQIELLNNPFGQGDILVSPMWSWVLSVFWIVFITNAINLVDGLDGLATGICLITALTIFFISKDLGRSPHLPYFALIVVGACAGFLIFNFSPARIFLGDSGSLNLGFLLACLSISGTSKRSAAIVMFGPPLILALPMADVFLAVIRRLFRRESLVTPQKPISDRFGFLWSRVREVFNADQEHIHHAMLAIGLSHRSAVIILYIVTMILGLTAYSVALYSHLISTVVVFALLSFSLVWLRRKFRRSKISKSEKNSLPTAPRP